MQAIQTLLDEYGSSHTHAGNKLLHSICVPLIVWSIIALLWSIPFPTGLQNDSIPLNWATLTVFLVQIYYYRLSINLGTGAFLFNLILLWLTAVMDEVSPVPLWQSALAVFVLAWIGQFVGHIFEGKRPAFFKDLQFLLIGPLWLISFIYKQLGLRY